MCWLLNIFEKSNMWVCCLAILYPAAVSKFLPIIENDSRSQFEWKSLAFIRTWMCSSRGTFFPSGTLDAA